MSTLLFVIICLACFIFGVVVGASFFNRKIWAKCHDKLHNWLHSSGNALKGVSNIEESPLLNP